MTNAATISFSSSLSPTQWAFDRLFVLCGRAPRASQLAELNRAPGLLPLGADGYNNVKRILCAGSIFLSNPEDEESRCLLVDAQDRDTDCVSMGIEAHIVPDRDRFRGTAGILRDAAERLPDDARILVVSASEVVQSDLNSVFERLVAVDADVVLCRDSGGQPVGCWSIRAGNLRAVSPVGYSDFKEQVLPALAKTQKVKVVTISEKECVRHWLCDLPSYLHCIRSLAGFQSGPQVLMEPGVSIASDALVVDAVLLRGATVESGAVVARSAVVSGVRVRPGQRVIDRVWTDKA